MLCTILYPKFQDIKILAYNDKQFRDAYENGPDTSKMKIQDLISVKESMLWRLANLIIQFRLCNCVEGPTPPTVNLTLGPKTNLSNYNTLPILMELLLFSEFTLSFMYGVVRPKLYPSYQPTCIISLPLFLYKSEMKWTLTFRDCIECDAEP